MKYTVLYVDDNKNNLFSIGELLKTIHNIKYIQTDNPKEGLNILLHKKVDLILLDIQMPEIDGFEFAKLVMKNKKTKDIPIIFITAVFKSEEFIAKGFEIGAIDYLTKPIDDHQLLNKLRLYLKIFEQRDRIKNSWERFFHITQSIKEGVLLFDKDGKITFANEAALEILGYESQEIIGVKGYERIFCLDKDNIKLPYDKCPITQNIESKRIYSNDKEMLIRKNGEIFTAQVYVEPYLSDEDDTCGELFIFRDRSDELRELELAKEKNEIKEQVIDSMVLMLESRDAYTAGHAKRVAKYSVMIAEAMGYPKDEIDLLKRAAELHDIGKIATPDAILLKPGRLNELEYGIIQKHLIDGYNMLKGIKQYDRLANIIKMHHERFDGSGYPDGLKGDEILPLGRILMVADSFDAMTTNRIYKPKKDVSQALKELQELSGVKYHPEVVAVAVEVLKDIEIEDTSKQIYDTLTHSQRFNYFFRDRLTMLYLFDYYELIVHYSFRDDFVYLYKVKLHNFFQYNKLHGWSAGDKLLKDFASFLTQQFNKCVIFRIEGDDFLIVSSKELPKIQSQLASFESLRESEVDFSVEEHHVPTHEKFEEIKKLVLG